MIFSPDLFCIAARLLAELVDKDDVCIDGSDILPDNDSAFDALFKDQQAMEVAYIFYHKIIFRILNLITLFLIYPHIHIYLYKLRIYRI